MPYKDSDRQRQYQREWIARVRSEYLHGKRCARCGSEDGLEIDHIDPASKVDHKVWSWSPARRKAELEKCQVLCRGCHHLKTHPCPHGRHRYERWGCRCYVCVEAKREHNRQRYLPRGPATSTVL